MQVVLSTIGKFHSFDLARQMLPRGALNRIFTGYPHFKLRREKLPRDKVRTFPWIQAPYMYLLPKHDGFRRFLEWQSVTSFDQFVASQMPECDIFMALSSCGLTSGKKAKSIGSKYICDRGSSHIRFQDRILREEYGRFGLRFGGVDARVIAREEEEYDQADAISVPSRFALDSFLKEGIPAGKLRLVPYGVDLSRFHPTKIPREGEFRILFAGNISVRKGLVYLLEAFDKVRHPKKSLTLVGTVEPVCANLLRPYSARTDVKVLGHLPQAELVNVMSASHVMVLPSVEEGLALVQAQAMACGCPVISSTNTGAEDLFEDGLEGYITPIRDSDAIARCLQLLADDPARRQKMSDAAQHRVKQIRGWDSYGQKMFAVFQELAGTPNLVPTHPG